MCRQLFLSLFLQNVVTENAATSLLGPFIKQRKLLYFLCSFMAYLTTPSLAQALLCRHFAAEPTPWAQIFSSAICVYFFITLFRSILIVLVLFCFACQHLHEIRYSTLKINQLCAMPICQRIIQLCFVTVELANFKCALKNVILTL